MRRRSARRSRASANACRGWPSARGARSRPLLQRLEARVAHSGQLLAALSYRSVLARGFALVRDEQGHPVHAAASVGPGARLDLEFADGRVGATADADRPAATRPASRRRASRRRQRRSAWSSRSVREACSRRSPAYLCRSAELHRSRLAAVRRLPRQPLRDALLRIGARFGIGAEMAAFRARRHPTRRRSHAAEDWRGRNRARRRDRPRSASARCGRARRRSSGGRPAARRRRPWRRSDSSVGTRALQPRPAEIRQSG